MATIAIRPTPDQQATIEALKVATKQKTASKALMVAAAEYPILTAKVAELEGKLANTGLRAVQREVALLRKAMADVTPTLEASEASAVPFAEVAAQYLETRNDLSKPALLNWQTTLGYVSLPDIGAILPADVADAVMAYKDKPTVADKLLSRIRAVLDYAIAQGIRQDNPAASAKALLPKAKVRGKHHASIPHKALGSVLRAASEAKAKLPVRLALRFLALTACRSMEVRGAQWDEFDLDAKVWRIPADRMKAKREHVVALSDAAVAVVKEARAHRQAWLIFPSDNAKHIPSQRLSDLLKVHYEDATLHGLRSAFKSWAIEQRKFRREAVEACLAHSISLTAVEAAYVKADLIEERREIMEAWADYLG